MRTKSARCDLQQSSYWCWLNLSLIDPGLVLVSQNQMQHTKSLPSLSG